LRYNASTAGRGEAARRRAAARWGRGAPRGAATRRHARQRRRAAATRRLEFPSVAPADAPTRAGWKIATGGESDSSTDEARVTRSLRRLVF
jgi:hypothetical protein